MAAKLFGYALSICWLSLATCLGGEPPMGTISGSITDVDGRAVPRARVYLYEQSPRGKIAYKDSDRTAKADDKGQYSRTVPAGTYAAIVADVYRSYQLTSEVRTNVIIKEGQVTTLDATLRRGGVITGTCSRDNEPVGRVKVSAVRDGWCWGKAMSDPKGNYTIRVKPQAYHLRFEYPAKGRDGKIEIKWALARSPEIAVSVDKTVKADMNVDSSTLAELFVTGLTKDMLHENNVVLEDATGTIVTSWHWRAIGGEPRTRGPWDSIVWSGLPPGKYTIHVLSSPIGPKDKAVTLKAGKNEVLIDLKQDPQ